MKAYAILDGGGVKGAALAGCLKAAEQRHIDFAGYGGTSAGAIIALLAAVGYTGDELEHIAVKEIEFTKFLDDEGKALVTLKKVSGIFAYKHLKWVRRAVTLIMLQATIQGVCDQFGLYHAKKLKDYLLGKIKQKLPALKNHNDITFADLRAQGCKPVKIVASDVRLGRAVTYSAEGGEDRNGSVISAVRASMSYPVVFQPVIMDANYLVDGGISSNLPVHLFLPEQRRDGLPVIAFDLIPQPVVLTADYNFNMFMGDIMSTTIEAGDQILRHVMNGVYHVQVRTDPEIKTLDFHIKENQRKRLLDNGYAATQEFFTTVVPHWFDATNKAQKLQVLHGDPEFIEGLLSWLVDQVERVSAAKNVRAPRIIERRRE